MIWWVAAALAADVTLQSVSPARDGRATAVIAFEDPAVAAQLAAEPDGLRAVVGLGRADVDAVRPATAGATVLAFDQSKSFSRFHAASVKGARGLVASLPDGPVGVAAFGTKFDHVGLAKSPAGLPGVLDDLQPPAQGATRLKSGITDAIRWAAELAPDAGALRQVVVFTDVGEESAEYGVDEVIAAARAAGVRVTLVAFPTNGRKLAERLDEAQRLADATGGALIQVEGAVPSALRDATSGAGVLVAELAFCGVPEGPGHADDELTFEIPGRKLRTNPLPLSQEVTGRSTRRCKGPTAVGTGDGAPRGDSPRDDSPRDDSPGAPGDDAPVEDLVWMAVIGGMALLLLLLAVAAVLVATMRRAPPPPREEPPPPEPEPVPPPEAPYVDPTTAADLPEARLVVERGLPPGTLRVTGKRVVLGAAADADLRLDHAQISGRHALLELFRSGALWITDLGSTNGTAVNGTALAANQRIQLHHGDVVALGRAVEARVELAGGDAPVPRRNVGTIIAPVTGDT